MSRHVSKFESVAQLPLEARNIIGSFEAANSKKRNRNTTRDLGSPPLFEPLALAVMNAKIYAGDDEKLDRLNDRIVAIKEKTVIRLARRLAPKAQAPEDFPDFDISMFDGDEPSSEQLQALEKKLEGSNWEGGAKPLPAAEFIAQARAVVDDLLEQLQEVSLPLRRL